jgi:adenine-specific DNA-methyltransferase
MRGKKGISKPANKARAVSKDAQQDGIGQYVHDDKQRPYNPPVGLVTHETDKEAPRKKYAYDPHMDPQLQWAGKAEHTSFEVDTVSLHVHERIDPMTIIEGVMKKQEQAQTSLATWFEQKEQNPPLREAIQFYKHSQNWSNRLIAGDSLLVMNSLLQKEGMAGKVQMVYFDPPYGVKYGSNFQPFVNKREVNDGKDEDLTQEPETIKAFRDTWELEVHSYLSYLRDRLLLARELLAETGSCFVQISSERIHLVRSIMDEIFGGKNFVSQIFFKKTTGAGSPSELLTPASVGDYLLWYAKDIDKKKFRRLFLKKEFGGEGTTGYKKIELKDGTRMSIAQWEKQNKKDFSYENLPEGAKVYSLDNLTSQSGGENSRFPIIFNGREYSIKRGSWKTNQVGIQRLIASKRIDVTEEGGIGYVRYFEDFVYIPITNLWTDTVGQNQFGGDKKYVVQTALSVVERCILSTTDPGDLVFDPTCGSGTTAFTAEKWGRRWITCDTSRVSIALSKLRLVTANFDYFELASLDNGIAGGFRYRGAEHITLSSIARNESAKNEVLYDQPFVNKEKIRIAGPFTLEAVPSPRVLNFDDAESLPPESSSPPPVYCLC